MDAACTIAAGLSAIVSCSDSQVPLSTFVPVLLLEDPLDGETSLSNRRYLSDVATSIFIALPGTIFTRFIS